MVSLMDLSNEMLVELFKYLDLPNRMKFRVNKRLDQIELAIPIQLRNLDMKIYPANSGRTHECELKVYPLNGKRINLKANDIDQWTMGLRRMALNTNTEHVHLWSRIRNDAEISLCMDLLFDFVAKKQIIFCSERYLPHVSLPRLLTLAKNAEDVFVNPICSSLKLRDLCTIREAVLDNQYKVTKIAVTVGWDLAKMYLNDCLGITLDGIDDCPRTVTYSAKNESVKLYSPRPRCSLSHYRTNLKTTFDWRFKIPLVTFEKCNETPEENDKILMNHLYEY